MKLSRWVVNLGAYDGRCGRGTAPLLKLVLENCEPMVASLDNASGKECFDPANCLMEEQHFHGLLLEGNESMALATHGRRATCVAYRPLSPK